MGSWGSRLMTHLDTGLWYHTKSPLTLDTVAPQSLDLNMLPWLLRLVNAAQAWLLLPGAEPAHSRGEPTATPNTRLVDLLSPGPTVSDPAEEPRARKCMGQAYSAPPSGRPPSPDCSVNTCLGRAI